MLIVGWVNVFIVSPQRLRPAWASGSRTVAPRRGSRPRPREPERETKQRRAHAAPTAGRRGRLFWASLALFLCCLLPTLAAQSAPDEAQVKAALVYNFAKFVEWPDDAAPQARPMVVGVLGDPELTAVIDRTLRNKTVRGRTFEVRHFTSIDDLALCHILFVAPQDAATVRRAIQLVQDSPTLTIGELDGFSGWGGVIELVLEEKQFRFEINAGTARRGGLKVSSRLLRLARSVKGN